MSAETRNARIVDVCVVGAGLSGAYAAHKLRKNGKSVAIVDSRHRVGGRLLTAEEQGGGDLGGAWIWPRSEPVMQQFLQAFDVKTVPEHLSGETMIKTQDGRRHVLPDGAQYAACGSGAVRVCGGVADVVRKLLQNDTNPHSEIYLGLRVTRVEADTNGLRITGVNSESNKDGKVSTINCRAAIFAAPPKMIANDIEFRPPLPNYKIDSMLSTPTWMEDYGKVSVSFPRNWWRKLNISAISIDQTGAVSTWWEACSGADGDGSKASLAGFVTEKGARTFQKMGNAETMCDYVMHSLSGLYCVDETTMGIRTGSAIKVSGSADRDGLVITKGDIVITYKSWLEDPHTNSSSYSKQNNSTRYGDTHLRQSVGRLFFAGTETASASGHMAGAIIAAQHAADEVIQYLNQPRPG